MVACAISESGMAPSPAKEYLKESAPTALGFAV